MTTTINTREDMFVEFAEILPCIATVSMEQYPDLLYTLAVLTNLLTMPNPDDVDVIRHVKLARWLYQESIAPPEIHRLVHGVLKEHTFTPKIVKGLLDEKTSATAALAASQASFRAATKVVAKLVAELPSSKVA